MKSVLQQEQYICSRSYTFVSNPHVRWAVSNRRVSKRPCWSFCAGLPIFVQLIRKLITDHFAEQFDDDHGSQSGRMRVFESVTNGDRLRQPSRHGGNGASQGATASNHRRLMLMAML